MLEDFAARTGFEPSPWEWEQIEYCYLRDYDDEENSDAFYEKFNSGWLLVEGGTKMSCDDYAALTERESKTLSDDEAKKIIHTMYGFDPAMLEIVREVECKEQHRDYRDVTRTVTFSREPRISYRDYPLFCLDYIRFNVISEVFPTPLEWEVINGELHSYTI